MRFLIVHNTRSGFGSDGIFEFERSLVSDGDECVLRVLGADTPAADLLQDARDFDLVVCSGGDGTVASILSELSNSGIPCCVFPSGTANLLFANIGNATEPAALARACRAGTHAHVDLARISATDDDGETLDRGYLLMCGMGYDADLMRAAIPNKQAMGEAAYFVAALSNPTPPTAHFTITVDGEVHEVDGITCMVANNAMIQADIEIIPDCRMDDGVLDVIVLQAADLGGIGRTLVHGILDRSGKQLGRPSIKHLSGSHVHVHADRAMPLQVDGDVVDKTVTDYDVQVLPGAATIVVDQMSRYFADDKSQESGGR